VPGAWGQTQAKPIFRNIQLSGHVTGLAELPQHYVWWNFSVKYWAGPGLGSVIAVIDVALSVKKCMLVMFGKSLMRLDALVAPIDSAAISASNTSVWPPRPICPVSTSLPW
jgi:hypothetical protein